MPQISRPEWTRVILLSIVLLLVSYVPYYVAFHDGPPGQVFGGFFLNTMDGNTYVAAMQLGIHGSWRFRLLYTPEPHPPTFMYFLYTALGHVSVWLGMSALSVYHAARLLSGFLLLLTEYVFISYFLASPAARWIAFLFATVASGLGWLQLLVTQRFASGGISPLDFLVIDAYTFLTVMHAPHLALGLAALLLLLVFVLVFFATGRWLFWAGAMVAAIDLGLLNPYGFLLGGGLLAAYWCVWVIVRRRLPPRRSTLGLLILGAAMAAGLAAYYFTFQSDPILRAFSDQDLMLWLDPAKYALAYGLGLLLALFGAAWLLAHRRYRKDAYLFLLVWVAVVTVLLGPIVNQKQWRTVTGFQVPVAILATIGLVHYLLPAIRRSHLAAALQTHLGYSRRRLRTLSLILLVILSLLSNVYLITSMILSARSGSGGLFYSADEVAAMDWLGANSRPRDTVLTSYPTGNFLPARTGHRVFIGHWDETAFFVEKETLLRAFWDPQTPDDFRRKLLTDYGIAYLFYGASERKLGAFDPDTAPYLRKVYGNASAQVYRVSLGS